MVNNWATVVHLLTRLGFISICIFVIAKTAIPVTIRMSRLSTITANQGGMILRTARLTKAEVNKSLSAMGSRYAPSTLCCSKYLAIRPSSPSLIAAILKTRSANENISLKRKITKRGVSNILITVKILGMFMLNYLFFHSPG